MVAGSISSSAITGPFCVFRDSITLPIITVSGSQNLALRKGASKTLARLAISCPFSVLPVTSNCISTLIPHYPFLWFYELARFPARNSFLTPNRQRLAQRRYYIQPAERQLTRGDSKYVSSLSPKAF